MTAVETFRTHLAACPLIAIVRGIVPEEAEAVGAALVEAGLRIIEVPLNSPRPFDSIARLAKLFGGHATIGAGTVLDPADVARVKAAGGVLTVSPNTSLPVIAATVEAGMVAAPGFFTPSEAFAALGAGAHALKLFPGEAATPVVVRAMLAVLPKTVPLLVVGGVTPPTMAAWLAAGATGFGIGSGVYKPGMTAVEVGVHARSYIASLNAASG